LDGSTERRVTQARRLLPRQPRGPLHGALARAAALAVSTLLVAGTASATELLEAKVTAGAETVLQNTGGTVRLERARVGATDHPTFYVPEPGALAQLGSGIGALVVLHARRRRRAPARPSSAVEG
jgi:hypothetical protein